MTPKSTMDKTEKRALIKTVAIRFAALPLLILLLVVLPAGTFHFWQAYLYMGTLVAPMTIVVLYFLRNDPKFLERRTRTREKEKGQGLIVLAACLSFVSSYIIAGLDRRYGWSHVPVGLVVAADVLVLLGYLMLFFVFRQNSYGSRVVETEQNQQVIVTGLYGVIRHPMYLAILIMFVPSSIALASYWGLIPYVVLPVLLVHRIVAEERYLRDHLPGYKEYCARTRYRILPYLW